MSARLYQCHSGGRLLDPVQLHQIRLFVLGLFIFRVETAVSLQKNVAEKPDYFKMVVFIR